VRGIKSSFPGYSVACSGRLRSIIGPTIFPLQLAADYGTIDLWVTINKVKEVTQP
jgi:hypothetical protein